MRVLVLAVLLALGGCKGADLPDSELGRLTAELRHLNAEGQLGNDPKLKAVAEARWASLTSAVGRDEAGVTAALLTAQEVATFPREVQPWLEQYVSRTGEFTASVREKTDGSADHVWMLRTGGQATPRLRVHFLHQLATPEAEPSRLVTLEAVQVGSHLLATRVMPLGPAPAPEFAVSSRGATRDLERVPTRKLLVALLKFSDTSPEPYTLAYARSSLDDNLIPKMMEMSGGKLTVQADLFGWWTMPMTKANCDLAKVEEQFYILAAQNGLDTASYQSFVMAIPGGVSGDCSGVSGLGDIGGSPSIIYLINNSFGSLGHELGHNLGLQHAQAWNRCDAGTYYGASNCNLVDYGSPNDMMGTGGGEVQAYAKERLGWLGTTDSNGILNVTSSGSYTLAPYEGTTGTRALKLLREAESTGSTTAWYFLEYRQPLGFDIGDTANTDGVLVSVATSAKQPHLLDMTQSTATRVDARLAPGSTYVDGVNGISVTTVSASDAGAVVTISLPTPSGCTHATPTVTLTARDTVVRGAGENKLFDLAITNNDVGCGAQTFDVTTAALPSGWTAFVNPPTVLAREGVPAKALIQITSPGTATPGTTVISATATSSTSSNFTATATNNHVVTSCVRAGRKRLVPAHHHQQQSGRVRQHHLRAQHVHRRRLGGFFTRGAHHARAAGFLHDHVDRLRRGR